MKKVIAILVSAILLCFANTVFADWFTNSTKVTRIASHDWGEVVLVYLESNVTYQEGCPTNGVVAIKRDHPAFEENFKIAMTALVTQKPVWGWMWGGCYYPENAEIGLGMPYVTRLDMYR